MPFQGDWMHCNLCQTLCYAGLWNGVTTGPCRGNPGGPHNFSGSQTYVLIYDEEAAPGQPNWKACQKCRELVFQNPNSGGNCAAGGAHDFTESGNYKATGGQSNWRWCDQCQAMVFAGPLPVPPVVPGVPALRTSSVEPVVAPMRTSPGLCPGPGPSQTHVHAGSNYTFVTIAAE